MCLSVSILSVGGEPSSKYSILFINSLFAQNTLFFPILFPFFLYNLLWILIITYQLIYLLIFVSIYLRIGHPHRLLFVLFEISIYFFLLLFYYFWKFLFSLFVLRFTACFSFFLLVSATSCIFTHWIKCPGPLLPIFYHKFPNQFISYIHWTLNSFLWRPPSHFLHPFSTCVFPA